MHHAGALSCFFPGGNKGVSAAGLAWADEMPPFELDSPPALPFTDGSKKENLLTPSTTCDEPESTTPGAATWEEEEPLPPEEPEKLLELKTVQEFIDLLHGELSRELLATATRLDSFFGDERAVLEDNRSYVRVRYEAFQEERASAVFRPAFDLRLVLPQLQKKTRLEFSAEPTTPPAGAPSPVTTPGEEIATTGKAGQAPEERNFTTALLYFFRSVPGESMVVRTGAQFSRGKPVLFTAPRYRKLVSLSAWDFRFTQEALYRTDTKWQANTRFDFERGLPHDLFFRTSVDGNWFADTTGYFYSLSFSLRQAFGLTRALDYEWINSYQTRPVHELVDMAFRIRYRRSFWREWLFFEVAPQIRSPRDRNFDATPGILFRLEMHFGKPA
jgi:hypothetical protein